MIKKTTICIAAASLLFGACKKEDKVSPTGTATIPYTSLSTTSNYFTTFKGFDGNSSVDFSGQTTRINMMKEMDAYIKTFATAPLDAGKLKNMYANTNTPFSDAALNSATDKTIISKTAQSFSATDADAERNWFNSCFDSVATASTFAGQTASAGVAGKLGNYLVNSRGFEYGQFIQKGLMGAMMLDQICNVYLGTEKMASDNSTVVSGKNYTQLEHSWDEAYGYLTSNAVYPSKDPADTTKWLESYLGSYVRQVGAPYGDPSAVFMAFLTGRAAIVNKDINVRDLQIEAIRTALEKAVGTVAISYLNKTKTATTEAARFHALSEGIGFVYSLRYAHNAKVNKVKSDELLNTLLGKPNGFWSLTNADLDTVRDQIASALGIDKEAVVNH